jgi:hypothetical protein
MLRRKQVMLKGLNQRINSKTNRTYYKQLERRYMGVGRLPSLEKRISQMRVQGWRRKTSWTYMMIILIPAAYKMKCSVHQTINMKKKLDQLANSAAMPIMLSKKISI